MSWNPKKFIKSTEEVVTPESKKAFFTNYDYSACQRKHPEPFCRQLIEDKHGVKLPTPATPFWKRVMENNYSQSEKPELDHPLMIANFSI